MDFCKIKEQQSILTKKEFCYFLYKNQRWTIGLCLEPKFSASPYMPPPGVPLELVLLSCRPGENYCTHHFFETFLPIFLLVSKYYRTFGGVNDRK